MSGDMKPTGKGTKPVIKPRLKPTVYKSSYANDAHDSQMADLKAKAAAAMPPGYQDPFNGVDPLTALLKGLHNQNGNSGSSGHGSGGGGGGGGSSGPSPEQIAAQQGLLDQLMLSTNQGFDQRQSQLQGIQGQANQRISGIMGELGTGSATARAATADSFAKGDQNLQNLMSQYQQIAAQRQAQGNQLLGAFGQAGAGAQGTLAPQGEGVTDMLMAGRTANTMRGNAADQMYADRGNVYNGLMGDAKMQSGQTLDALLAKLAQERQANSNDIALQKAQVGLTALR